MPSYYIYGEYNPSAQNQPNIGSWENTTDWPRSYQYTPAYSFVQGLHPPAPVYQSNQPTGAPMYYYGNPGTHSPQAYHASNAYYYSQSPPSGWPYSSSFYPCYPVPSQQNYLSNYFNPYSTAPHSPYVDFNNPQACAAAALAANTAIANAPNAPCFFVGKTQAEIDMQNAILTTAYANAGLTAPGMPTQLAPYKPTSTQQFWCKEMDGSWTLREQREVMMGEISPGHWEKHATSGYYYWVRHTG